VQELDPTRGPNLIARIYSQMVFDTLFALDHKLSPKPMMVDRESVGDDRLTYTFTLRSGLKFHDGSPVTTRDVVASLNRWMNGTSVGGQLRRRVAGLAIVDELTFTLTLKEKFGLVEFMLAGAGAPIPAILREKDANRPDGEAMTAPIGSGPFKLRRRRAGFGPSVVFERYADYPARPEPPDGLAAARWSRSIGSSGRSFPIRPRRRARSPMAKSISGKASRPIWRRSCGSAASSCAAPTPCHRSPSSVEFPDPAVQRCSGRAGPWR